MIENLNQMEGIEQARTAETAPARDKADYLRAILSLSDKEKAFVEGYLYAIVTARQKTA